MSGRSLVRVRDLRVAFPARQERPVVDGVSFEVRAGEVVALVGQSGSGKSVTARTLLGLAGDGARVTAAELTLGGRSVLDATPAQWRALRGREVGLVLQDALTSLDPLRTVGQEVGETLGRTATRERRVLDVLDRVGIPDPGVRARQHPHQLSGGLRQRALIASAVVADPGLVIADEPTTALDVTVQRRVLALLRELTTRERGVLLISHDLAVVAQVADRVLVLHEGRVVESGDVDDVLTRPDHPCTRRLLAAVPSAATRGQRLVPRTDPDPVPAARPGEPGAGPLLRVRDATVRFRGPRRTTRTAVDGVSFDLHPGRVLGVVGGSGSGKSTVARAVLGLQPLDGGGVELFGTPWSALPERRRRPLRRRVQTISQDPLGTFDPRLTVDRLLARPLRLAGWDSNRLRAESTRLLGLVGLGADVLAVRPRDLSGGQRQRVSIAQALAGDPDLLVADEPVSALDVLTQAHVLDLLLDVQRRTGLAVLFISHDLGVVHHVSHDVLVLQDGRVVESGAVDDVFHRPQHAYTRELLRAVPVLPARVV